MSSLVFAFHQPPIMGQKPPEASRHDSMEEIAFENPRKTPPKEKPAPPNAMPPPPEGKMPIPPFSNVFTAAPVIEFFGAENISSIWKYGSIINH